MSKGYRTLGKAASEEFIVNKSRFIGHGAPVTSEEEALQYLSSIRERYRDASHHCYAYIIGKNAGIMRYQDDGEPSGTAGQPIIEVMKVREVVNACVVVVRYFGGVLLGAGGLTRAYSKGAAAAIDACGVVSMEPSARLQLSLPYALWDRAQHRFGTLPLIVEDVNYGANVECILRTRTKDRDELAVQVANISDGKAELVELSLDDYAWPAEDEGSA